MWVLFITVVAVSIEEPLTPREADICPTADSLLPSKVRLASPCTVLESTEVITLLSPDVLYVVIAPADIPLKVLPSP